MTPEEMLAIGLDWIAEAFEPEKREEEEKDEGTALQGLGSEKLPDGL